MKSYLSYFKLRIITNLQYRADAWAGVSTQIFFGFMFIMVYLAFYESGTDSALPMNYQELVTYIWLQQAFFALIYPYEKDKELLDMIKNGNLAYELIRPQDFYFKWYIKFLSKKIVSTLLRMWPILLLGYILPYPYHLSLPISFMNLVIFIISLILSVLLISSINLLIHILTMYTIDDKGFITIYAAIAEVFMGGTIPLPFFPDWLLKIANLLPFRYIGDFPFRIYSGSISLYEGTHLLIGSFIWIIIIIALGYFISKITLRKAVMQGG